MLRLECEGRWPQLLAVHPQCSCLPLGHRASCTTCHLTKIRAVGVRSAIWIQFVKQDIYTPSSSLLYVVVHSLCVEREFHVTRYRVAKRYAPPRRQFDGDISTMLHPANMLLKRRRRWLCWWPYTASTSRLEFAISHSQRIIPSLW